MKSTISFLADEVSVSSAHFDQVMVTLEADMCAVVEDISVAERLYELDPSQIVATAGAINLLNAMSEPHFAQWVKANGDFYEALNAIGIERIQEWISDYTGGD